uniref:Uncharacterized protein n=1 Tax=viral metagenome TaxID=1070528 RepID=A0A6C0F714_9ZZZZ|tara:strand:- start:3678 stop:4136 length:459 start_codon:yes stop_codon:yes gene_type:complete
MEKLQGYHLILLLLAYYSSIKEQEFKIDTVISEKVPDILSKIPYIEYLTLLLLFLLKNSELGLFIWILVTSYKALRNILNDTKTKLTNYIPSIICIAMLVSIYDGTISKQHLILSYGCMMLIYMLFISSKKTTASNILEDIVLSHLIFYFAK